MPGDGAEVNAAVRETMEELRPWMEWVNPIPTVAQSEERQRQARAAFLQRTDLPLNLYQKDGETFVGGSGLHRMNWEVPRFEIGYWCRKRLQGQGYISEAVRGITRFAFETLKANRVEIRCDVTNERSRLVAESCGYTLEATLRNNGRRVDGTLRDTLLFALIPEEFLRVHGR
jgi:RimJ/RimL family protein N-acetyltransferase